MTEGYVPGQQHPVVDAATIYETLEEAKGNISEAARMLGMRRYALRERIDATPLLIKLMDDLREERIDKSETNIFNEVDKGSESASRFVLQTLGKGRGWAMGVAGTGKDGEIIVQVNKLAPAEQAE